MPKYSVKIKVTRILEKPLKVYAGDEIEAEEKATDLAMEWEGVEDVEVVECEEI